MDEKFLPKEIVSKKNEADELAKAYHELAFEKKERIRLAAELLIAQNELAFQKEEKSKRAAELVIANKELAFQKEEKGKRAAELGIANIELAYQDDEKGKRAAELGIANIELAYQDEEKGKRAEELGIANREKRKRAAELGIANIELAYQDEEKGKRAEELIIANKELIFQNNEKEKRAAELGIANKELVFQNDEKEKRAAELSVANKELAFQNKEKEKRAAELGIANIELALQNELKEKRAQELIIANQELAFQNEEKEKRAAELIIANNELVFQNEEKGKRADELVIANKELIFQNEEKEKRAAELAIAGIELEFQNKEKEKKEIANKELEAFSDSLKRASQYARSLIEASTDPLVTISLEGKIMDVNEASTKVTGETRIKLIGTDFSDYFTEPEKAREGYKKVFENGFVYDYPLTIRHKNGRLTDVLYNASVYKDDKGNVLGVFAAARDVTAQKLLSKYSLSLIEASRDPLVTISTEGKITDMNEATVNITGVSREKLKGTDFKDYFTDPKKASEVYQEVFSKGFVADYPLTLMDDKLTDVLFNGSVYKDDRGNVLGAVIVARDITEQKRIEKELREAKELAERLAGAKDQFLASMSHEIRTPLNGIIGFTKILLRNETTEKQRHQLDAIKTSSDILLVLINDILDLSKIEAGKMNIETTELKLSELINSVLGTFELRFQEKGLKINKQFDDTIPKILIGDPVRINQILLNLLSNSVKFTENGGQISIRVNLLEENEEKATVEFLISDTGIGIPQEKLETIFSPFMQSGSDITRKYGGTGLGLSIVKRLMDLMEGGISVKSKLNEGSTFTVTLPLLKTTATEILKVTEKQIHKDELERLSKLKVLLVDDIPINQFLGQTILHDFGFEADTAENGKIAIQLLQENDYDIILMDLMMPEMDGFEATKFIRNNMQPPKSNTPIIALTADVTKADVDRCKEVGMNEYVSKPINETDLLNKITKLVKKSFTTALPRQIEEAKIFNLEYLQKHSNNKPKFVEEMVRMFLTDTPAYLAGMKSCLAAADWHGLHGNAHKIIPSINFFGLPKETASDLKLIDTYAGKQQNLELIPDLFLKVEKVLLQAYKELGEEYENTIGKQ